MEKKNKCVEEDFTCGSPGQAIGKALIARQTGAYNQHGSGDHRDYTHYAGRLSPEMSNKKHTKPRSTRHLFSSARARTEAFCIQDL